MIEGKPETIKLTENHIIPMLNTLPEDTRDMAINMLTLSIFPVETHPDTAPIIQTLVHCVLLDTPSDNPIIIAAQTIREIYSLAHGQHGIEDIIQLLMMEYTSIAA